MNRPRRRRILRIVGFSALGFLGLLLVVALSLPVLAGYLISTQARTRPQDLLLASTPFDHGLRYESVWFGTADGVRIAGWLIPAPEPAGCSAALAHGLFRSRREVLVQAAFLARSGCDALLIDLRGHGGSGPGRTSIGAFERRDVMAAIGFLRERRPGDRTYALGVSMGGAAAAGAAAEAAEPVAGVVLDSVFRTLPEVVGNYTALFGLPRFPAAALARLGLRLGSGVRSRDLDIEAVSRRLGERGIPVLVLAGTEDRQTPAAGQEAIFRANGHPSSRYVAFEGAGHAEPCEIPADRCLEEIGAFVSAR